MYKKAKFTLTIATNFRVLYRLNEQYSAQVQLLV